MCNIKTKSGIIVDERLMKFISFIEGENGDWSISLVDLGETFLFKGKEFAQLFLNEQAVERFGGERLRKGYFEYVNDDAEIERYNIKKLFKGRIEEFDVEIVEFECRCERCGMNVSTAPCDCPPEGCCYTDDF